MNEEPDSNSSSSFSDIKIDEEEYISDNAWNTIETTQSLSGLIPKKDRSSIAPFLMTKNEVIAGLQAIMNAYKPAKISKVNNNTLKSIM